MERFISLAGSEFRRDDVLVGDTLVALRRAVLGGALDVTVARRRLIMLRIGLTRRFIARRHVVMFDVARLFVLLARFVALDVALTVQALVGLGNPHFGVGTLRRR